MLRVKRWVVWGLGAVLMLLILLIAASALVNLTLPTKSAVVEQLSTAEKGRLSEFNQARTQLGGAIWPNWDTAEIPIIVYNEQYAFLVGYPDPPDGWFKVPRHELRGGPWEQVPDDTFAGEPYYRQKLPTTGETPEAFTVLVGERWVTSMPTQEWMEISFANQFRESLPAFLVPIFPYSLTNKLFLRGSDGYISLLAHESFHAFQGSINPERLAAAETAVGLVEAHYPNEEDEAFREAWQRELDSLAEALQAETVAETTALTKQFLAERQQRQHTLSPELIAYEEQREWLEGLARYVELELWRQAAKSPTYQPSAAVLQDPDFDSYEGFEQRWAQEIDQLKRMATDMGGGRFYYSGMAQAVLLDRLLPEWKHRILQEPISLTEYLSTAVNSSTAD